MCLFKKMFSLLIILVLVVTFSGIVSISNATEPVKTLKDLSYLNKENCAFIIVDMQNDFILDGAPVFCPGGQALIPRIKQMTSLMHKLDIPVIYTQMMFRPGKIDYGRMLDKLNVERLVEGTKGVEFVDELQPQANDYIVKKRRYSAFYEADMESLLKGLNKKVLIITGVATDVCVYATASEANQRGYRVIMLNDCVAGHGVTGEKVHEAFLRNVDILLGDVISSEELTKVLK